MKIITNVKMPIDASIQDLKIKASKMANIKIDSVKHFKIKKKSLDARDKSQLKYVYTVEISHKTENNSQFEYKKCKKQANVLVVGAGPAGLFCALDLLRYGHKVTLIERGKSVENRNKSISSFISTRVLDEESNIQFGEGGAGCFSDGKLNTGVNNEYVSRVISDFVEFGAPSEIEYLAKPHIGSDNLPTVIKNMRNRILEMGGKVLFETKFTDFSVENGCIKTVTFGNFKESFDEVVLAVGHSAQDVYKLLNQKGVFLESKEFAVGLRIEHLAKDINESQYSKDFKKYKNLPTADYKLVTSLNGRGAFTFCMCPGGYVMPSSSNKNTVVVNGMSNFKRNAENSNSAIVVQVKKSDFGEGVFDGLNYINNLEQKAFILGGGDYSAPSMLVGDYLKGELSTNLGKVKPTYPLGVKNANLSNLFSKEIDETLKFAISDMAKKIKCFDNYDAVLTGVESRTSSPIRVTRTENGNSVTLSNLYPCGEGCGYAGGITSAGADGKKIAKFINLKYGEE
ncbi:MAG: FAD-dependent oxidoreductase [Clostridia bacterium]|nr:FAD-dependent oxidoreductase [Clostridia bacterium]